MTSPASPPPYRRWLALAAAIVAALAAVIGALQAIDTGGGGPSAPTATTAPPAQRPPVPTVADPGTQLSPAQEQREVQSGSHEDQRDESPPGAPPGAADQVVDGSKQIPTAPPVSGGAQNLRCPAATVRNRSARAPGAKVVQVVLHYTVSSPFSGPAIIRFFDTASAGASSNIVLQPDGWCRLIVPYSDKAWTQGAFNSVSESVEITARGTETRAWWLGQRIFKAGLLAEWVRDRLQARGLPLRRVDPVGCTPQAGWTDHNALECGNDHHDVAPNFPYDVLARQLARRATSTDQVTCRKLNWWRAHGRPKGAPEANAVRRRRALDARNVACTSRGAVLR